MAVEMVETLINGRWKLILPAHRAARPEWHTEKGWERARLDSMSERISKGDVVYYVGSEEGEMPALCQMWGARVVLFEPNPKVWSNTKAIWLANGLTDPWCFYGFASNETTGDDWSGDWPECADEVIEAAHGFKELDKEAANYPQYRIDDVAAFMAPPTAISIDVEGSEGHVLRGAEQTLRKYHPTIWLSLHPEFLLTQYGEWGAELREWVRNLGYKETLLDYQHEVHLLYTAEERSS